MKEYVGGILRSEDGEIQVQSDSHIRAIGEQIQGKSISLSAKDRIDLSAGTSTSKVTTDSRSKGASLGVTVGLGTGSVLGFDGSYQKGLEEGTREKETHVGTHIVSTHRTSLEFGADISILGSTVKGNVVEAKVRRNIHVESLQDTERFRGNSSSKGIVTSTNLGPIGTGYTLITSYENIQEDFSFYSYRSCCFLGFFNSSKYNL